ncbi:DUF512 domain-containing protein [Pseudoflavonifractor sp. MSJ-37]|uniref:DUF512 domain-containing protein n=1 Tax=Pseudoflavonifractor sp. MSJ-37 TaxID=2841531 RepID=UPI001C0F4AE9|nr:DUF512 domain-containing protein [Pseudoflavonifractor sp. MSJ-37]MBU5434344.1 DUF512 domain-containing protein [Pseudoflavonifractor sp. MSJ-37]
MSLTKIRTVDPGSPAQRAGLRPGETVIQVNGHTIVDVLDYKFYTYDARLELGLRDGDGSVRTVVLEKAEGEDLGLNFETYLMDKARSCANNCVFCFVDQMPPGMRETLYFKDDDARLSFLMGNYITLTNLSEREIQRIMDLRVSPINVSVQATDPEVRRMLLKNRRAGECLDIMRRFAAAGITMNCQVVACPGLNDGPVLQRTMEDLAELWPGVNSVAVVPVGLTKFREGLCHLESYTPEGAAAVIDQVEAFAARSLRERGTRLVWCSDEFYLEADRPQPEEETFEGFGQLENGVGMLRLLESEFHSALLSVEGDEEPTSFTIATGVAAAPTIAKLVEEAKAKCPALKGEVVTIANHFFGETITVAGLITGRDLIDQLRERELGERLLIPVNMLRHEENVFLDDVTIEQVEDALGVTLVPVEQDGGALLDALFDVDWDDGGTVEWVPCGDEDDEDDEDEAWDDAYEEYDGEEREEPAPAEEYYRYNPPRGRAEREGE